MSALPSSDPATFSSSSDGRLTALHGLKSAQSSGTYVLPHSAASGSSLPSTALSSQTTVSRHSDTPFSSQSQAESQSRRSGRYASKRSEDFCQPSPNRPTTPSLDGVCSSASSPSSEASGSPTFAAKRTISGTFKAATSAEQAYSSGSMGKEKAHIRNGSSISVGNMVGELSSQLKARLSYAMFKVQNGWERRSIDEVETLASQLASATASASSPRNPLSPSFGAMASMNRTSCDLSRVVNHGDNAPSTLHRSWPVQEESAYNFSTCLMSNGSTQRLSYARGSPVPVLAPAPDLTSSRRRRSTNQKLPRLTTHTSPKSIKSQALAQTAQPSTPTPQEQEAVDTLLFMSSPANSGRFSHSQGNEAHGHFTNGDAQASPSRRWVPAPHPSQVSAVGGMGSGSDGDPHRGVEGADCVTNERLERQRKRRSTGLGIDGSIGLMKQRDVSAVTGAMVNGTVSRDAMDVQRG